jgi:hypothetical protein
MNNALLGAFTTIKLHINARFVHKKAIHYFRTSAALRAIYVLLLIHPKVCINTHAHPKQQNITIMNSYVICIIFDDATFSVFSDYYFLFSCMAGRFNRKRGA